jgi:hemerythrin-like domain-containing protein
VCQYCGCRAVPLIRDYIAEHDDVLDLLDAALRAIAVDDLDRAVAGVHEAREALARHWAGEENGIFTVMAARDDEYARYVAPLIEEHRELEHFLAHVDLSVKQGQADLRTAFEELKEHISKEEDGLFPASLTALDGDDWNASMAAWQDAHPSERMLSD